MRTLAAWPLALFSLWACAPDAPEEVATLRIARSPSTQVGNPEEERRLAGDRRGEGRRPERGVEGERRGEPREAPPEAPLADAAPSPVQEPVLRDCAEGQRWSYTSPDLDSPSLYLGAVYETRGDHSGGFHPEGEARVQFSLPGASVLALSSYEPTHWVIEAAPEAELLEVVVVGYHAQRVTAPEGVRVQIHSLEQGQGSEAFCGYSLPYNGGGCDTDALIAEVERLTGLGVGQFDGCYRANTFVYGGR